MKTGITNAAQIQNNTIINTTRITKGYAFDDATLVPITIKNAEYFGYITGFNDKLVGLIYDIDYKYYSPIKNIRNDENITPLINITSVLNARVVCFYDYTDGQQFFLVPPPDDLELKINGELITIAELPSDSGLAVMSGNYGFNKNFTIGETYTLTCNNKYKLNYSEIVIDDEFITKNWSFGSNKFQSDKLKFTINIENV